jgi:ankyrin repeat protein
MGKIKKLSIIIITFSNLAFAQQFELLADKVIEKDTEGIRYLLNQGIDVNVKQLSTGSTVLMLASSYFGYEDMVEYLLLNGADANATDNNGKTPLIWSASNSLESAKLLISKGADVNKAAYDGRTPFIQAVFGVLSGKVPLEMCDLLRENGADVNATLTGYNAAGWSALHYAAMEGSEELVKYLITCGANVNKSTAEGSTALFLAKIEGYQEIVNILRSAGAKN